MESELAGGMNADALAFVPSVRPHRKLTAFSRCTLIAGVSCGLAAVFFHLSILGGRRIA